MIIIDSNENSEHPTFYNSLIKIFPDDVVVESLKAGDFYICGKDKDCVIERKSVFDFLNSLGDGGRIWDQLPRMKDYEGNVEHRIILEGYWGLYRKRKWGESSIYAQMDSIVQSWNVPIIPTPDIRGTLCYIAWKASFLATEHVPKKHSLRGSVSRKMSLPDKMLYVIQGLPNISSILSERVIEKYGTVLDALNNIDKWSSDIQGIGGEKQAQIKEVLTSKWSRDNPDK